MINKSVEKILPNGIYKIRDNGIRCFIPPCFSWDILNLQGKLLTTVSDIDFSSLEESTNNQNIQENISNEELCVYGYVIPLPESDGVRQAARFVILKKLPN